MHKFFVLIAGITMSISQHSTAATAQTVFDATEQRPYSIPNADAPELAKLGSYRVGIMELQFTDPARPNIIEALAGRNPIAERNVPVTVWYPTQEQGEGAVYTGKINFRPGTRPPEVPETYRFKGMATEGAPPVTEGQFPLIVISHGYGNWATFLSYLGENLASKGYIVASIEHNDLPYTDLASFNLSFGDTMLNRMRDQRLTIEKLVSLASSGDGLGAIINADHIGLIGYSMGGFGAIASAGAGYTHQSPSLNQIPAPMLAGMLNDEQFLRPHPALKAVVAIAPWGAGPINRAWSPDSLKGIDTPLLFIAGDHDDVSGYEDGIKWLFESATGADRHMLVYENGRHSIGGNPEPPFSHDYFDMTDWFNEPVWRRDRVVGINQHFITAFMNLHLKGDEEAASFMDVQPTRSSEGEWPIPSGGYTGGAYSSGDQDGKAYWKGFQRRWALGLQMHNAKAE